MTPSRCGRSLDPSGERRDLFSHRCGRSPLSQRNRPFSESVPRTAQRRRSPNSDFSCCRDRGVGRPRGETPRLVRSFLARAISPADEFAAADSARGGTSRLATGRTAARSAAHPTRSAAADRATAPNGAPGRRVHAVATLAPRSGRTRDHRGRASGILAGRISFGEVLSSGEQLHRCFGAPRLLSDVPVRCPSARPTPRGVVLRWVFLRWVFLCWVFLRWVSLHGERLSTRSNRDHRPRSRRPSTRRTSEPRPPLDRTDLLRFESPPVCESVPATGVTTCLRPVSDGSRAVRRQ